jgi:hypothetical protein
MSPLIIVGIIVAIIALIFLILIALNPCKMEDIKNDESPVKAFLFCLISPLVWT